MIAVLLWQPSRAFLFSVEGNSELRLGRSDPRAYSDDWTSLTVTKELQKHLAIK
jgi:hypothetical protein